MNSIFSPEQQKKAPVDLTTRGSYNSPKYTSAEPFLKLLARDASQFLSTSELVQTDRGVKGEAFLKVKDVVVTWKQEGARNNVVCTVESFCIINIYNLHIINNEGHKDTQRTIK